MSFILTQSTISVEPYWEFRIPSSIRSSRHQLLRRPRPFGTGQTCLCLHRVPSVVWSIFRRRPLANRNGSISRARVWILLRGSFRGMRRSSSSRCRLTVLIARSKAVVFCAVAREQVVWWQRNASVLDQNSLRWLTSMYAQRSDVSSS